MGSRVKEMWKNWGKVGLNALAMPAEILTGRNLYNPKIGGSLTGGIERVTDTTAQVGAAIAPAALNAVVPGAGTALKVGREFIPAGVGNETNNNFQANQKVATSQANALYEVGGPLSGMAIQGAGPNLYAFDGPSHEEGGIKFNESAEIEKQETIDPSSKYVYSDKTMVPGTDKTFADASKKWKGSSTDDDITKKTNQLMLDRLRNNQEELKEQDFKKAVKRFEKKYGGYMKQKKQEAMAKGGYYTPQEANTAGEKFVNKQTAYGSNAGNYSGTTQYFDGGAMMSAFAGGGGGDISSIINMLKPALQGLTGDGTKALDPNSTLGKLSENGLHLAGGKAPQEGIVNTGASSYISPELINTFAPMITSMFKDGGYMHPMTYGGPMHQMPDGSMMPGATHEEAMQMGMYKHGGGLTKYETGGGFMETMKGFFDPNYQSYTSENNYGADISTKEGQDTFLQRQTADKAGTLEQPDRFNFQDVQRGAEQAGQFANIAYNLKQGREPVDYYKGQFNPEYAKSIGLMSDREYDAEPQLQEARNTFDKTKDLIQDMSGGSSALALAGIGGAQIRRDNAMQRILANKNNADNQYSAEEARFRGNMGSERMREDIQVELNRLKADAAKEAFNAQAAEDVSRLSQTKMKERGQKSRDADLLAMLQGEYGGLSSKMEELLKGFENSNAK